MASLRSLPSLVRSLSTLLIVSLVIAACSSSDGGESNPGQTTTAPSAEPQPSGEEPTGGDQDTEPDASNGDLWAVVTIGDETYEFGAGENNGCFVGEEDIFKAGFLGEDGLILGESFLSLEVSLPPDGLDAAALSMPWDAYAHVTVVIGESAQWEANAYESTPESTSNRNIPEGLTQVDSFQFDASGASGTATFLDMENLTFDQETSSNFGDPMSGSFEVSCG